jgi:uncharacterized protein (TIGR02996 family)
MTATHALMQAVLRHPADDLARLVFADEIERDEPEFAAFIRAQINDDEEYWIDNPGKELCDFTSLRTDWNDWQATLTWAKELDPIMPENSMNYSTVNWSRGFPSAISLPMALLMGGECPVCTNESVSETMNELGRQIGRMLPCPRCHGTGRTKSLFDTIFSQWPVERVTVSDKQPLPYGRDPEIDRWGWFRLVSIDDESTVPDVLWQLMTGYNLCGGEPSNIKWFPTRDAALIALSHAIVDLGRHRAGLPAIRRHGHDADTFREERKRIEQFQDQ